MIQILDGVRKVARSGLAKAERAHMQFINIEVLDPGRDRQPGSEFVGPEVLSRNQVGFLSRRSRFERLANDIGAPISSNHHPGAIARGA